MGKKRAAVGGAVTAPVFPFPAAAAEPDHFSDYGFDPQLLRFFSQPEAQRPSSRRHHSQPPPLESTRFKLEKPISKKHQHHHKQKQQKQRRRWWSSAASAALLLFRRPSSSGSNPATTVAAAAPASSSGFPTSANGPLYLADGDGDGCGNDTAACTCWASAMRSGHLAAAELSAASSVQYVSLRDANLGGGGAGDGGGAAPAMPIYLVT